MSTNRVVVTGYGVTSPIGNTPEEFWNSLHDGKIGIKPITKFDASEIPVFNAGEIQDFPFDKYFVKKDTNRMDTYSLYAIYAAMDALENSGLNMEEENRDRVGVIVSSGIGGLQELEDQIIRMHERGMKRIKPMFIPKALSTTEDPERSSIPFDKDRNGFVMGEGAGVLVIESLEHAQKRGANILAEIVGYGSNCDAYHMTTPTPDGSGAAKAIKLAINEAGIKPEDVDYVNAHGTSTPANEKGESGAIVSVLGKEVPVSSTKSFTGHLLGAAGAVEAIATIEAIRHSYVPKTAGTKELSDYIEANVVYGEGQEADIKYAISNTFGFGGHNAVLAFKRWED